MSDDKDRHTRIHDRGQEDYANDKGYNAPHSGLATLIAGNSQDHDDNRAYAEGWSNAKEQDKS